VLLRPGDTVYVPRREPVYVLGQVKNQGAVPIPFEYPLTVSKAVALSGGFTPYARHNRVRVRRAVRHAGGAKAQGTEIFTVDVSAFLSGSASAEDFVLEPGDMVYVPERVF
jgi:protein involved in polysaccharide export with SLBB domain